ncbi:hypothetical protein GVO57_06320 [Sphingomonas changnyeongensis]|uniref:Uncharacterized protein n=1 Tax=Sphingomonas changnyeongensis TaxID=2698679 RepID=A0A7Z2NVY2_9SPHN|nr:hypothetical protein [Sphingomonas changnyeongensis]QHL90527.1 hypothetical protein GVO57_06320 [Sphingomonas changnyeongensis]
MMEIEAMSIRLRSRILCFLAIFLSATSASLLVIRYYDLRERFYNDVIEATTLPESLYLTSLRKPKARSDCPIVYSNQDAKMWDFEIVDTSVRDRIEKISLVYASLAWKNASIFEKNLGIWPKQGDTKWVARMVMRAAEEMRLILMLQRLADCKLGDPITVTGHLTHFPPRSRPAFAGLRGAA